ncbi:ABC transporter ATP-binding protein [Fulvivirgaceae bacterium PWU5]|uniref:ABC transporter ATP-binding protein n=1 Tax=Dawidia cretensis TaxID=2782350 RepID=A0AAP2E231_9BACT|nr:ABC transporter ATP-binding protein [Dawidia cretensis]MBT1710634.1 ABC transporter ATP-binding protein [Dawidia cretensis]
MLSLSNFRKYYGSHLALSIDTLQFQPGAYWVKGENGAGKTTFFKALAGLLPCQGTVQFDDGTSLHAHPVAYRRRVHYAEAEPLYPGFLTGKDLLRFAGKARQAPEGQQQELVEAFAMSRYFETPCETYSSGMMKKLSLALAFLGSPTVILLDEPLITLDEQARRRLFDRIRTAAERQNVTFLISSHQLWEPELLPVQGVCQVANQTVVAA